MELLLILSAMLSAVTGAISGVRPPEARIHHAEASVAAEHIAPLAREAAQRPVADAPEAAPDAAKLTVLPRFALAAPIALDTDRLIE